MPIDWANVKFCECGHLEQVHNPKCQGLKGSPWNNTERSCDCIRFVEMKEQKR